MKKRIHLKKRRKMKKRDVLLLTLVISFIGVFMLLQKINSTFSPIIYDVAEMEVKNLSTIVINNAISKVLKDEVITDDLFTTVVSNEGNIQTVDFNPVVVNKLLNTATTIVQKNLKLFEKGDVSSIGSSELGLEDNRLEQFGKGIITQIPIGVIMKNTVLSNLGPSIPIRLHFLGDVSSNITTKITQYGINNALVEVGIHLEMSAQIILPLTIKKVDFNYNIPLTIKMIQGKIPNYYSNGITRDSALYTIPIE